MYMLCSALKNLYLNLIILSKTRKGRHYSEPIICCIRSAKVSASERGGATQNYGDDADHPRLYGAAQHHGQQADT